MGFTPLHSMLGPESEHPSLVLCLLTNHILPAYRIVSESGKAPDAVREIPDLHALSVAQGVQYVSGLMHLDSFLGIGRKSSKIGASPQETWATNMAEIDKPETPSSDDYGIASLLAHWKQQARQTVVKVADTVSVKDQVIGPESIQSFETVVPPELLNSPDILLQATIINLGDKTTEGQQNCPQTQLIDALIASW